MKEIKFEELAKGKFIAVWKHDRQLWCDDYLVDDDGDFFVYDSVQDSWVREDLETFLVNKERLNYKLYIAN